MGEFSLSSRLEPKLRRGETLLWQGQPDHQLAIGYLQGIALLILAVWIGVFLFNIPKTVEEEASVYVFIGGLIGVPLAFLATLFGPMLRRRRSLYALSNKRAFIGFHWPIFGARIYSWPITQGSSFHVVRPAPLSLYFAQHRLLNTNPPLRFGFQRIAEGERVLQMMQEIREGDAGHYAYTAPSSPDKAL